MKRNILKNSSTLLRFLISEMDKNNNCKVGKIYDYSTDYVSIDINNLLDELSQKNYIQITSMNSVHILPLGIEKYGTPLKTFWTNTKKPISYIVTYILGLLSAVATQLIINALNE